MLKKKKRNGMKRNSPEIKLTTEQLRELQLVELDILVELDRICRKNQIDYFLCGGTLLGAVRHGGFIPWDDDVDVGFFRRDYERFCDAFQREADGTKYFLQTWKTDKYYRWNYGKIRRRGTEYIRCGQEHMKYITGISIDIFAYDYLPLDEALRLEMAKNTQIDNIGTEICYTIDEKFVKTDRMKAFRRQAFICALLRKAAWSACGKYQETRGHMRIMYSLIALIPGQVYASLLEKAARKYNDTRKYGGAGVRQFAYASDFKTPAVGWRSDKLKERIEIEFEKHCFLTVKDVDWYLTGTFGKQYMELPPIEKRAGVAPVCKIDFGNVLDHNKTMTPSQLRIMQLIELEMLLEIDRICCKYHIKYTIIGGTLLGAVRHNGFIPWDDDADVAMLRSDYDAFVIACQMELDESRFYYQDQWNTKGYRWGYGKLRRKGTCFIRTATEDMSYEQGVFVDVFPLDYLPNGKIGQWICEKKCFIYRKATWSMVGKITEQNPVYRFFYHTLSQIPLEKINRMFLRYVKKLNREPTHFLRCLSVPSVTAKKHDGYWRYKTQWLEELVQYEFEGYRLTGIKHAALPLRRMYGDYMTPVKFPPLSYSDFRLLPLDEIQVRPELKEGLVCGEK